MPYFRPPPELLRSYDTGRAVGPALGVMGLVNQVQPRKADDWAVLRAWAWGASRALDYFEADKTVDARHVALEVHSRWGKACAPLARPQQFLSWPGYVAHSVVLTFRKPCKGFTVVPLRGGDRREDLPFERIIRRWMFG